MQHNLAVASFNVYNNSPDAQANRAIRRILRGGVTLLGLQEFGGPDRRAILEGLHDIGYDYFKPRAHPSTPGIVYNAKRLEILHGESVVVAEGRKIIKLPGRRGRLGDVDLTVASFKDSLTGRWIHFGNWHSPSHIEFWPGPRREMAREALHGIVDELDLDGEVATFLSADWNWDLRKKDALANKILNKAGMTCCWDNNKPNAGTRGRRVIDGVFSTEKAVGAVVLDSISVSDHKPVVACYNLANKK